MNFLGRALAMIARDVCDDLHLFIVEILQIAIRNQIHAVLVMALATDVPADVVQQGGVFDQLAIDGAEAVKRSEFIEQSQAQRGHLVGVPLMPIAPSRQNEPGSAPGGRDIATDGKNRNGPRKINEQDSLPPRG